LHSPPSTQLPTASTRDTIRLLLDVIAPTLAKGPIIRRRRWVGLAGRFDLDDRAVKRMRRLRERYGPGPLLLRLPGFHRAMILDPQDVLRVLRESPDPFATASTEKRAALAHFEPGGVLISHGPLRAERRRYNEVILDSDRPIHRLSRQFVAVVGQELRPLVETASGPTSLTWDDFAPRWFRVIRRVVLGDAARDDEQLTDQLAALRRDANWAMFHPLRRSLRARFTHRLEWHLSRAESGSLAGLMAQTSHSAETAPVQQVPQWLFAFDAAGMATYRALALLAAHPQFARDAQAEAAKRDVTQEPLPLLRATLLESVRLWPTTPLILRESVRETRWQTGMMPARTGVAIYAPFFHRDPDRLPFADRFAPEVWKNPQAGEAWSLVPFSAGPATCPGQNLVLLLASAALQVFLRAGTLKLGSPSSLNSKPPLPVTLDHYRLRLRLDRTSALG
jgi:cytochrome P450